MIIPTKCPICNDVLLTIWETDFIVKKCEKYLNHYIKFWANEASNEVLFLLIKIFDGTKITYVTFFLKKLILRVRVRTGNADLSIRLPYFEPDFSDYKKLINKIKTCIAFS